MYLSQKDMPKTHAKDMPRKKLNKEYKLSSLYFSMFLEQKNKPFSLM